MGILATIKDKVKDQFGIFDDVQDYADFAERQTREFERKAKLAKKVVDQLEREIGGARDLDDLKNDSDIRSLKAVLRSLRSDVDSMVRETSKVMSKANRDKEIGPKVRPAMRRLESEAQKFSAKLKEAEANIGVLEDEQKNLFREMRNEDAELTAARTRKLASKAGRVSGAVVAVLGVASLLARLAKGI